MREEANGPDEQAVVYQIIARAWSDEQFKATVLSDPAGVMRDYGLNVPEGLTVQIHENTSTVSHVVLPMKPQGATPEELEDPELIFGDGCDWLLYVT